jgi:N,N-dimethylformamidase
MTQLVGYVSDESHVAIEGATLEFIRGEGEGRTSVEAHSRASGAVYADLEPGEWIVAVGKPGFGRKLTDIDVEPGMAPRRFRLLADRLLGYAWPKWVRAGEQVELRMHASEPFWVTIWRYGWEKQQVADLGRFESFGPGGDRQIVPDEDFASTGCQWNHHG